MRTFHLMTWLWLCCLTLTQATPYWKHRALQGNVSSCHTFTTLALIEAEYQRNTGRHLNLSERDLFIRYYMGKHNNATSLIHAHLSTALKKELPLFYGETGSIPKDFKLLKQHGVCLEKELRYRPLLKHGVAFAVTRLREARSTIQAEAQWLRARQQYTSLTTSRLLEKHSRQLNRTSIHRVFTPPPTTATSRHIKQWLAPYSLQTVIPKTTPEAKAHIITKIQTHPVAVDITNLRELANLPFDSNAPHGKHSLIVYAYDATSDTFTTRSATHKKPFKVSADALSRGTYRFFHLTR